MGRTSMRRAIASVVVLLGYLGTSTQIRGAQQSSAEQQLMQLERDWCTANVKKDVAVISRILADDYTGVGSRGTAQTKAETLADLNDKTSGFTSCVDGNVKVRIYGEAAVVTGLGTRGGTYKGVPFKDRQFLWTDTFVRREGRWQCVASQATVVAAQQK